MGTDIEKPRTEEIKSIMKALKNESPGQKNEVAYENIEQWRNTETDSTRTNFKDIWICETTPRA